MNIFVQTSATGLEDDHFSMTATSPFHRADLLRSLYCTEETVNAGPKGVLRRMSALMAKVTAKYADENAEYESVTEAAFQRDTSKSMVLFDELAAKHHEEAPSTSTSTNSVSRKTKKIPGQVLHENTNVGASVTSNTGPASKKGTRMSLPAAAGRPGTSKQPLTEHRISRTTRKRRPSASLSLKYTAVHTTSKEARQRLREQVKQNIRESRLKNMSSEWETQLRGSGYIPDDLTATANNIPQQTIVFKTALDASLEWYLTQECLNSSRK